MGEAGDGAAQPVQARVDVLAPGLDESVAVEDEGVTSGVGHVGLGPGDVFGVRAERRVGGLVEEVAGAVGVQQDRRRVANRRSNDRSPAIA